MADQAVLNRGSLVVGATMLCGLGAISRASAQPTAPDVVPASTGLAEVPLRDGVTLTIDAGDRSRSSVSTGRQFRTALTR
jgi:hypothetical protein